jgi:hypothetical protein
MKTESNSPSGITIRAVVLAAGCLVALAGIVWFSIGPGDGGAEATDASGAVVSNPPIAEATASGTPSLQARIEPTGSTAMDDAPEADAAPVGGAELISEIIANPNLDFPSAVNNLLQILPGLGGEDQAEAAQHAANLSDDQSAARWTAMLVANQIPPAAAEVFFNDLLNRPHELTMPALAAMADQSYHPLHESSIEILEVLYGTPPQGTPWAGHVKTQIEQQAAAGN